MLSYEITVLSFSPLRAARYSRSMASSPPGPSGPARSARWSSASLLRRTCVMLSRWVALHDDDDGGGRRASSSRYSIAGRRCSSCGFSMRRRDREECTGLSRRNSRFRVLAGGTRADRDALEAAVVVAAVI